MTARKESAETEARSSSGGQAGTTLELIERYYSDRAYRESLPCGECGTVGGCSHFPAEAQA